MRIFFLTQMSIYDLKIIVFQPPQYSTNGHRPRKNKCVIRVFSERTSDTYFIIYKTGMKLVYLFYKFNLLVHLGRNSDGAHVITSIIG